MKKEPAVHLDLDYFDQGDFSGVHRSGWAFAVRGIRERFSPPPSSSDEDDFDSIEGQEDDGSITTSTPNPTIRLDAYVDRTFHWKQESLLKSGVLPYPADIPWAGFVHHTFDTTHSEHNCTRLLKNEVFLESLKGCVALLVLSEHLASRMRDELDALVQSGHLAPENSPPVYSMKHPTEFVSEGRMFSMDKFERNRDRRLVQVGAWLRNPYAIYEVVMRPSNFPVQKAALQGMDMVPYFPPQNFGGMIDAMRKSAESFWRERDPDGDRIPGSATDVNYRYGEGVLARLERNHGKVKRMGPVDDDAYDALLSENVVFLDLIDASAVNTAIECVVRNTPLIVNRVPAIEETLGTDYPGFYGTNDGSVHDVASSWQVYRRCHEHMQSAIDKSEYRLETFLGRLEDVVLSVLESGK